MQKHGAFKNKFLGEIMNKTTLAIFFLFIATGQSSAMQPLAARTAGQIAKHYGKKGFSGMMTALHWYIAAGASINEGVKKIKDLSNEEKNLAAGGYTDATDDVSNFVVSTIKETHNIKINAVKIEPISPYDDNPFPHIASQRKHIIMNSSTATEITNALKDNDQKTLDKWRAAIEHESNHIKNEDLLLRAAADLTMPFITHGSVKIIRNILPFAKKTRSFLGEQLIKIPTACGKRDITFFSKMSLCRYQEQRADNQVSDNLNRLTALKPHFEDLHDHQIGDLKKIFNTSNENIERINWMFNFLQEHPLPKKRIEKLDQRIASLEKQSEENEKILS